MQGFRQLCFIHLWLVAGAPAAFACQHCSVTLSYNAFPFTAVWFYLFWVWLLVAWMAGASMAKTHGGSAFRFVRPGLKMMIALPVFWFLGAHLLAYMIALPILLFKPSLGWRIPDAPRFYLWSARAIVILMLISIPASYSFPKVLNEPGVRIEVTTQKERMRQLAVEIEAFKDQNGQLPMGLSALQLSQETLSADAFHYGSQLFLPASFAMLGMGMYSFKVDLEPQPLFYATDGQRGWLVSRGPDGVLNLDLEALPALADEQIGNYSYDPTNGSFSPGDIIRPLHWIDSAH